MRFRHERRRYLLRRSLAASLLIAVGLSVSGCGNPDEPKPVAEVKPVEVHSFRLEYYIGIPSTERFDDVTKVSFQKPCLWHTECKPLFSKNIRHTVFDGKVWWDWEVDPAGKIVKVARTNLAAVKRVLTKEGGAERLFFAHSFVLPTLTDPYSPNWASGSFAQDVRNDEDASKREEPLDSIAATVLEYSSDSVPKRIAMKMWFAKSDCILRKMIVYGPKGQNDVVTTVRRIELNPKLNADEFRFEPPKGIVIVEDPLELRKPEKAKETPSKK